MTRCAIVVPCYNEEEVFEDSNSKLLGLINDLIKKDKISSNSYILYVDDGSKDQTWNKIKTAFDDSNNVYGLKLAGNKGHQNALYAGLMYVKDNVDIAISIDADLQDDIDVIEEMIDHYRNGSDIVYGVRNDRSSDSFFKRFTAQTFYKLMNVLGANSVYNHADFRLMSKRAIEELSLYKESHLFLRGIMLDLGFETSCVYYSRKKRLAGESKYPLSKMISFAFNGITSFSIKPLTAILYVGIISIVISFITIIYAIVRHFTGATITGWTSVFASIWFIGGIQLVSIGIIGQYVGKNFIESKHRPRYFIAEYLNREKPKND